MAEQTEERTLPASLKKLRDARRKGKASQSKDLVAGLGLLAAVAYLFYRWPTIVDDITGLIDAVAASLDQPFSEIWQNTAAHAVHVLFVAVVPLAVIVFVVGMLSGMIGTLGPVFSFENVALKFEHINPVEGAKRLFSLRNLVEFAKSVVKVVILAVAFWSVLRGFVQSLLETPACGHSCLAPAVVSTLQPLAATAAIAFVTIGIIDVLLQYRLYLRDMRMTRTELKREFKDLEGDPLIRGARRQLRREVTTTRVRVGVRHAVVVITHGDRAVGLRYNLDDTRVPTITAKGRGPISIAMLAEAKSLGIPIVDDAALTEGLINKHAIGDRIREDFFNPVAAILVGLKL
jgi:type III secretion protein U